MKLVKAGSKQFQKLCDRNSGRNKRVFASVRRASRCAACRADADHRNFSEHQERIPG